MKTKIKKIFSLVANLALAVTFVFAVGALSGCDESKNENGNLPSLNNYLDEIQSYIITIDPQNDATLKMKYSIEWKVLNDKSEGPLEWVKIGIPNKYVYGITFDGDVKKAEYYSVNSIKSLDAITRSSESFDSSIFLLLRIMLLSI